MKIIIDTNLWISFLLGGKIQRTLFDILASKESTIISTQRLIDEIVSVATRKKFAKYISENQITALIEFILKKSDNYPLINIPARCRDPKDDYLLELSIVSNADYLVTGDDDLLSIGKIGNCKIITAAELHSRLK